MNRRLFLGSLASLPIALLASPDGVYQGPWRVVRRWRIAEGGPAFDVYDLRDTLYERVRDGDAWRWEALR